MKYYKLNCYGTKWGCIDINKVDVNDYKQINLYDDNLEFIGIGLY